MEKAYKKFDQNVHKFVFKHDFVYERVLIGLEFSNEELAKIWSKSM